MYHFFTAKTHRNIPAESTFDDIPVVWVYYRGFHEANNTCKELYSVHTSSVRLYILPPQLKYARKYPWTLTHSFYAAAGGFSLEGHSGDYLQQNEIPVYQLSYLGVIKILEEDPNLFPDISEASVWARSQRDSLSKFLAIAQTFSFCLTLVLRRHEKLSISLLELSTLGYALCAIIAYAFSWKKPDIVMEPILIRETGGSTSATLAAIRQEIVTSHVKNEVCGLTKAKLTGYQELYNIMKEMGEMATKQSTAIFTKRDTNALIDWRFHLPYMIVLPLTFGFVHLLAWRIQFFTHTEVILWRTSIIINMVLGVILTFDLAEIGRFLFTGNTKSLRFVLVSSWFIILLSLFTLARLCMIVMILRQLGFLPTDAFQVASWSSYLPQFS